MLLALLLQCALAQSNEVAEEVIVIGGRSADEARGRVLDAFDEAGWRVHKERRDGSTVLRHAADRWKGSFVLGAEGSVRTRRPVVYTNGVSIFPPSFSANALPSQRKLKGPRARAIAHVQPSLNALHDARAAEAEVANADDLITRLDRLWSTGEPPDGGPILIDAAARRAAVLDLWATRTESAAGRRMMARISDWIEAVIQRSDRPLTADEIATAEARRDDGARVLPR
jgi:hypothetical protein